jgi:NTP pyrophosphatase (non-canonical NTP hydrolase)
MQLNEYQQLSKRTLNAELILEDQLVNYSLGVAGEAGEVADIVKKAVYHGHLLDKDEIVKELGDVLFYVAAIASTLHISLDEIAEKNVEKLLKRYPNGFSQKASLERVE